MSLLREYLRGLLAEVDYSLVAGLSGKRMWYLEGDWETASIEKIVDNLFGDSPWVLTVPDLNRLFEWFHVSDSWIGDDVGTVMEPRVPRNPWEDEDGRVIEDEFDPRISLAPTVEKALHALGSPTAGYVYAVDIKDKSGDEIETRVPFGSHCPSSPSNAYGEDFNWEKYAHHSGVDPDDDLHREPAVISCVPDQQATQEVWHRSELWMVDVGKVGPDMKVRLSWDFIRWYGEQTGTLGRKDIVPGMTLDPIRSIDADEEKTLLDITQAMGHPEGEYPKLELSDKKEANESMVRKYINEISVEELQASQDAAAEQHGVSQQNAGGDCYQAAGRYMMDNCLEADRCDDLTLVHGEVAGQGPLEGLTFGHAWVLDGGMVIDKANGRDLQVPKPFYYAIGQIDYIGNTVEYSWEEARKYILEYEHWGPWGLETESGL